MAYISFQPSDYFNTKLYTGTGATNAQTSVGFQPDWVWIQNRGGTYASVVYDAVRGATKQIEPQGTGGEATVSDTLTSFDSDGFTLGADSSSYCNRSSSPNTYVAWNWKANGSGSANTDGSISSTVSANTTAGFSIVSFTGNGSNDATIGHGLGTTPAMIITKNRDDSVSWRVWHQDLTSTYVLLLNSTDAELAPSGQSNGYIKTVGSSTYSVYQGNTDTNGVNGSGDNMIAYCFAEKKGFSKFGSYTGNGNADGPFIYTGFKPAFLIYKVASGTTGSWGILDNKRDPFNVTDATLTANGSGAEAQDLDFDFVSNGFKVREAGGSNNQSGATYIYLAFASEPLVSSNDIPATAR